MTQYINFESAVPYAPGLNKSSIMSGQSPLYSAISSECGASFMSGAVQAAGGLSGGLVSNGAGRTVSAGSGALGLLVAVLGAVATVLVAAL